MLQFAAKPVRYCLLMALALWSAMPPLACGEEGSAEHLLRLAQELDAQHAEAAALATAWRSEEARLDAQAAAYAELLDQAKAQLAVRQQRLQELAQDQEAAAAALRASRQPVAQIDALYAPLAARWQDLQQRSLLVTLPPAQAATDLESLLQHWQQALVESRLMSRHVRDGWRRDTGQRQAVEILRIGLAIAWWQALDGSSHGLVMVDDQGRLGLQPAADAAEQAAIARLFALYHGHIQPQLQAAPWDLP